MLLENHTKYDEQKREEFIKLIANSANETLKLLNNLLDWARTQTDGIVFNPKNHKLEEIFIELIAQNENYANDKNIKLYNVLPKDINVFADFDMLNTILRNLISNAIKFTHRNGEIKITAEQTNNNVTISVTDTGVGISKENQEKIFDISEKMTTEGTENETGTGLGLLLCKEFVETHNGKIWIESEVGNGATFLFTIPSNT